MTRSKRFGTPCSPRTVACGEDGERACMRLYTWNTRARVWVMCYETAVREPREESPLDELSSSSCIRSLSATFAIASLAIRFGLK